MVLCLTCWSLYDLSGICIPPCTCVVSLISVCLHKRIFGSYSNTVPSERKTNTELSGSSFMDFTDTFGEVGDSRESPTEEKRLKCELRCFRISTKEQEYSKEQVSRES